MMGYTLKNLKITNFKYITDEEPLFIDFENGDIIVLNGQNGYGKTTVFDAIEILLTGKMNRITQLLNKGSISTIELANDIKKDIVIEGSLDNEHEIVSIKRVVTLTDQSNIFWNDELITQNDLFTKLKVSEELIRLGIYLSQSQSLDFLQNKYKDRKSKVASLVESPVISRKVDLIKGIETQLTKRVSEKSAEIKDEYDRLVNRISLISEDINKTESATGMTSEYISLFEGKYPFDLPELDTETPFDSVVLPLRELRQFVSDYEAFSIYMKNGLVDRALNASKHVYTKIFYRKAVKNVLDSKEKIESMSDCYSYLNEIESQKYVVNDNIFTLVGLDMVFAQKLKERIIEANEVHSYMGVLAKTISEIQDARKSLISKYEKAVSDGHMVKDICPLCGTALKDAADCFLKTEKRLLEESEKNVVRYNAINNEIARTFEEVVKPKIKDWLQADIKLYADYLFLRKCLTLDTAEIDELLSALGCSFCALETDVVDEALFEAKYQELMNSIKTLVQEPKSILEKDVIEKYKSISALYFEDKRPEVSVEIIDQKIGYIAKQYSSNLYKELTDENVKLKSLTEKKEKFERGSKIVIDNIIALRKKYVDSQKEYQTKLVNDLRLPLLIYSGKIIQNYPLGLGIDMKVNDNQLVFEAAGKENLDAFNILSTGQLNGLAISVMLAVRKVFGNSEGLDLLMIDDPLQTIDDISAITFTDMLINDQIGQVILSTHEERKARMMEYKFNQAGYKVCERNMKDMYIKSKLA